jgi:hypothetical protein
MLSAGICLYAYKPKLIIMKKMLLRQFVSSVCVTAFMCLASNTLHAQCKYSVVNVKNDTTTYTIPCDFPIKANTGDSTADHNNFIAAFQAWNQAIASLNGMELPTVITSGIKTVFFTISAADYNLFPVEKKNALKIYPELYQIGNN